MRWLNWAVFVMWVIALVVLGCSPATDVGNGDDPISKDEPDHLLNWLAKSYQDKDIELYDEALHDAFIFVFTEDVADSLGLDPEEPWWGKTRDVTSTQKMFSSSEVTEVNMSYISVDRWVAVTDSVGGEEYNGVFSRVQPDILVTVEKPGKEPMRYVVNESYLDITVVQDPNYPDQTLWVVLKIEEIPMNPE